MNILGQEQPIIYKMDDMFDPTTAQMFLNAQQNYVNAMRQDYMQGVQDMKEYNKLYGNFFSPFTKDNSNWDRLFNKPIRDLLANYGPDLLRSREGRAAIQQAIMSAPSGELAKLKANAKIGFDVLAERRALEAKGLYSQAYQDFLDQQAGRTSFENWDTLKDGVYSSAPSPFEQLGQVTDYIYKGRQPLYKGMKNGNRVYSYDYNDLLNAAQSNAQDFINTPRGAFEWKIAQDLAKQQNPNASEDQLTQAAYNILDKRIADANRRWLSPEKYEADPFALDDYKTNNELKLYKQKAEYDNSHSGGAGGKSNRTEYDIFDEADANVNNGGVYFEKKNMYNHKIDPLKNKNIQYVNGTKQQYFSVAEKDMKNLLYRASDFNKAVKNQKPLTTIHIVNPSNAYTVAQDGTDSAVYNTTHRFNIIPTGELRAVTVADGKDKNGKTKLRKKYYIACNVSKVFKKGIVTNGNAANEDVKFKMIKDPEGNDETFYMEVEKRGAQYTTPGKNKYFK